MSAGHPHRRPNEAHAIEQIQVPPKDLDCTPYLDDPDHNDNRVLAVYRQLGVTDADRPGGERGSR